MPLVNPRLYKSALNKEMKQKRKEAMVEKELQAKEEEDHQASEQVHDPVASIPTEAKEDP